MPSYNEVANPGLFIGTTTDYDIQLLQSVDINSDDFRRLMTRLYESVNSISIALNLKDTGYYPLTEFVNGQLYFPDPTLSSTTANAPVYRQVFRVAIDFGALPNGAISTTKTVNYTLPLTAAGVANYSITRIYGSATEPATLTFIPLPYTSNTANQSIELYANIDNPLVPTAMQATVVVGAGVDWSSYTKTYIVLEYIKQ